MSDHHLASVSYGKNQKEELEEVIACTHICAHDLSGIN